MKLATLKDGTRDGQLAVVARDLKTAHIADGIVPTLQAALDDWSFIAPQLMALYEDLNAGRARRPFDFDPDRCMAPLPRAYQFVVGTDRGSHEGDEPRMVQCCSDDLLGPTDDIVAPHEAWDVDFGAGLAVVTGDVAMGATLDDAYQQVRLLVLVNEVRLHRPGALELAQNVESPQSRPPSSFAPLAVTPDELGEAWRGGKANLPLRVTWNGRLVGEPHGGTGTAFSFPQLIAHLAANRNVRAGSIVGSGVISVQETSLGYASIAQQRRREHDEHGTVVTPFMQAGDTVVIDILDEAGHSLCGAIRQRVDRLKT